MVEDKKNYVLVGFFFCLFLVMLLLMSGRGWWCQRCFSVLNEVDLELNYFSAAIFILNIINFLSCYSASTSVTSLFYNYFLLRLFLLHWSKQHTWKWLIYTSTFCFFIKLYKWYTLLLLSDFHYVYITILSYHRCLLHICCLHVHINIIS